MTTIPILYIVVPCYNEQECLTDSAQKLKNKLCDLIKRELCAVGSRILFVDDGSKDTTWEIISSLHGTDPIFSGLKLAHNCGHQNALLAGLEAAKEFSDITVSIDADLQDDTDAIDAMVKKYREGCDIVYGVRSSRKKDSFFKRNTALIFYRSMRLMGVESVYNHADFRLMSRRAVEGLLSFKEVNLFLRGLVPMIGYKTGTVEYERGVRLAGESKYPFKKMVAFAVEGITSMSIKPIRMITALGFFVFLVSIALLIYSFVRYFMGATVSGWASLSVSIWAIGGLQLLAIGVVGEYIGKIYLEVKGRPRYIVESFLE